MKKLILTKEFSNAFTDEAKKLDFKAYYINSRERFRLMLLELETAIDAEPDLPQPTASWLGGFYDALIEEIAPILESSLKEVK